MEIIDFDFRYSVHSLKIPSSTKQRKDFDVLEAFFGCFICSHLWTDSQGGCFVEAEGFSSLFLYEYGFIHIFSCCGGRKLDLS